MPDNDGNMVNPQELIRRVKALIDHAGETNSKSDEFSSDADTPYASPSDFGKQVERLSDLHEKLSPPLIPSYSAIAALKRVMRRAVAWFVEPRFQVLEELEGIQNDILRQQVSASSQLETQLERAVRQLKLLKLQVSGTFPKVFEVLDDYASVMKDLREVVEDESRNLEDRLHKSETFQSLCSEVELLKDFVRSLAEEFNRDLLEPPEVDYVSFENVFRGSEQSISDQQLYYLGFLPPIDDERPILDIGCGRGEMLNTLQRSGHVAVGVDLNTDMVQLCIAKGLNAFHGDAIEYLKRQEDGHFKAIFCSQVVEHLTTAELKVLVQESARTIGAGGTAIFETIDPRSLFALGNHFYADLTHVRPVHPQSLRFLCEALGFKSAQIVGRSPHEVMTEIEELPTDSVGRVVRRMVQDFYGYQDFAVVAVK